MINKKQKEMLALIIFVCLLVLFCIFRMSLPMIAYDIEQDPTVLFLILTSSVVIGGVIGFIKLKD